MRIALATRNQGKVEEMRLALEDVGVSVTTVDDCDGFAEVEETESTLEGNAALKSKALFEFSGIPALADDTGLEVDALGGEPGVLSARYAGDDCNPARNRRRLLDELAGVLGRSARFRTVLAFTDRRGTTFFEGVCQGVILEGERGVGGFGYDAIFLADGQNKSFAELSTAEKNRISHRGKAVAAFIRFMKDYEASP